MTSLIRIRAHSYMSNSEKKQYKLEEEELEIKIAKIKGTYKKKVDRTTDNIRKLTELIEKDGIAGIWFLATPTRHHGDKHD